VRHYGSPLVVDAPAATATVMEAIAQLEAFVERESMAALARTPQVAADPVDVADPVMADPVDVEVDQVDFVADFGTDPVADEDPLADYKSAVAKHLANWDSATDDSEDDGFIELDLSGFIEDEFQTAAAPAPQRRDDEDDELFVYEISAIGDRDESGVGDEGDRDDTDSVATFAAALEGWNARPTVTTSVTAKAPAPRATATNDANDWTPMRLGVSQLWPRMDGVVIDSAGSGRDERARFTAHTPSRRAQARHKPIQDEWGFFDPEQCGFAALLAKLDEIIDTDDRSA
jgi:hypothetical protein